MVGFTLHREGGEGKEGVNHEPSPRISCTDGEEVCRRLLQRKETRNEVKRSGVVGSFGQQAAGCQQIL